MRRNRRCLSTRRKKVSASAGIRAKEAMRREERPLSGGRISVKAGACARECPMPQGTADAGQQGWGL